MASAPAHRIQFSLRTAVIGSLAAGVLLGIGIWLLPYIDNFRHYGRFFVIRINETLQNPQQVVGWNENGLQLADGRRIPLPGVKKLPATSTTLSAATKRGIEINNGRVTGLIRVNHWCGNDPVREHWARLDLADALQYVNEGQFDPAAQEVLNANPPPIRGAWAFRWDPGDYDGFRHWRQMRDDFKREQAGSLGEISRGGAIKTNRESAQQK